MTDKQLDRDIKSYIKEIKSLLICDHKTQSKFIGDIKSRINDHIENGLINNIDDIYKRMGSPHDIAMAFFENADVKKVKKKMNITKIILVGVITALVIWTSVLLGAVIHSYVEEPGYVVDEVVDGEEYNEEIAISSEGEKTE